METLEERLRSLETIISQLKDCKHSFEDIPSLYGQKYTVSKFESLISAINFHKNAVAEDIEFGTKSSL